MTAIKHIGEVVHSLIEDKVNGVNLIVFISTIWAQFIANIGFSAMATGIAHWIQTIIGIAAGAFLLAYNALRFYREWNKNTQQHEDD